jgi:hypothetical protein
MGLAHRIHVETTFVDVGNETAPETVAQAFRALATA